MDDIKFEIRKKLKKQNVDTKQLMLKLSYEFGEAKGPRILEEANEKVKFVLKVPKKCADFINLLESIILIKDPQIFDNSNFIKFISGGFERKRIILQSLQDTDDKKIYEITFDSFYNESLINQAYHLLDLSGNQGPQIGYLIFNGDIESFELQAKFSSSQKDSIFNLLQKWDPQILKNPYLAFLKSIKKGFVFFEIEDWPEGLIEFFDYLRLNLTHNNDDQQAINTILNERNFQFEFFLEIQDKFKIKAEYVIQ